MVNQLVPDLASTHNIDLIGKQVSFLNLLIPLKGTASHKMGSFCSITYIDKFIPNLSKEQYKCPQGHSTIHFRIYVNNLETKQCSQCPSKESLFRVRCSSCYWQVCSTHLQHCKLCKSTKFATAKDRCSECGTANLYFVKRCKACSWTTCFAHELLLHWKICNQSSYQYISQPGYCFYSEYLRNTTEQKLYQNLKCDKGIVLKCKTCQSRFCVQCSKREINKQEWQGHQQQILLQQIKKKDDSIANKMNEMDKVQPKNLRGYQKEERRSKDLRGSQNNLFRK